MNVTMGDALWRCAIVMVDGMCVASETMDDHKAHSEEVFSRLASRGHALKPKKVELLKEEVGYLGHISTPKGIKITPGQREAIIKMPYPLDSEGDVEETRLRSFIGLANFSWRYIDNFAMHACRLNGLLQKESAVIWTLAHAISYDAIKYGIAWSKGLYQIDYKRPSFVCTDAWARRGLEVTFIRNYPGVMKSVLCSISYARRQKPKRSGTRVNWSYWRRSPLWNSFSIIWMVSNSL